MIYYLGREQIVIQVKFYDKVDDELLKYAVIVTRSQGKWVFCKHRARDTYEVPGGHREIGESIEEAARRELYEETGAIEYELRPVCVYSVVSSNKAGVPEEESFGMLYEADVYKFEEELHSEIEKIIITEEFPEKWTYPEIQPKLIREMQRRNEE